MVSASLALATAHAGHARCEGGGRLLCSAARLIATIFETSLFKADVGAWSALAASLLLIAGLQWPRRAR
jgi:hypothetical protein